MAQRVVFRRGRHTVQHTQPLIASDRSTGIFYRHYLDTRVARTWSFSDEYSRSEADWIKVQCEGRAGFLAPYDQRQPQWEWIPPGAASPIYVAFVGSITDVPFSVAATRLDFALEEILSPDT